MNERLRSAPNAVDLAHAVLPQKRAQLRGHLAEAEAEFGRAATERELVSLGEVNFGRLPVDRSGRLENEQVVVKGVVEIAGREAHFVLRHHFVLAGLRQEVFGDHASPALVIDDSLVPGWIAIDENGTRIDCHVAFAFRTYVP